MRNLEIINNTFNGNGHDSVLIDANRFAGTNTSRNGVFGDRSVESTWCWRARQRYLGYDAHSLPLSRQHGPGMARTPRRAAAVVMLRFGVSPRGAFR